MSYKTEAAWNQSFIDPSKQRLTKPRHTGMTMVIDKGLGLSHFADLLETSANHIDFIKLGFGTSVLYPSSILLEKLKMANEHHVTLYTGGTFFEIAFAQGKVEEYFNNVLEWGFDTVEISDGSITLSRQQRNKSLKIAQDMGLQILTECGKKESGSSLELMEIEETLYQDLQYGAKYMIIEGRESGENVGIYNSNGGIDPHFISSVKNRLSDFTDVLLWEAPKKEQQVSFVRNFGSNVNIGNIAPQDIYALESLRRGLRSDTFSLGLSYFQMDTM